MGLGISTIIVSGGIQSGSPFTLHAIPQVAQATSPQTLTDSIMKEVAASNATTFAIAVGADPVSSPGTTSEGLRTLLGLISDYGTDKNGFVAGKGAAVAGGAGAASQIICIGFNASVGSSVSQGAILIGSSGSYTAASSPGVAIGTGVVHAGQGSGVVIGGSATLTSQVGSFAGGGVVIGNSATLDSGNTGLLGTVIGANATGHGGSIVISSGATTVQVNGQQNVYIGAGAGILTSGNNNIVIGATNSTVAPEIIAASNTIIFGDGQSSNSGEVMFGWGGLTTQGAGNWQFGGTTQPLVALWLGQGANGVAAPGLVRLIATPGLGTDIPGGTLQFFGSLSTGAAVGGGIQFRTGVTGTTGTTRQTSANALTIADGTQICTFSKRINLTEIIATGAVALTLTNGPTTATAGPPQAYVRVQIGGVNYAIPAWTV
jgi:hypothetical protein